jgi:ribosomal protein S1
MTKNNKMTTFHKQQDFIPLERTYQDNIDLFITSPKDLIEGTILLVTNSSIYLDFGTKPIIKVSKKEYIKNLIQTYTILNTSYLLTKRYPKTEEFSREDLKSWLKQKLNKGNKVQLKVDTIDSIKNINTVNFNKTLDYIKYNKFFNEIESIKKADQSVRGYILQSIKGGFSVAIGGIIAFLPAKQLMKNPNRKLSNSFINSSMEFKISKITTNNKNIVLEKA